MRLELEYDLGLGSGLCKHSIKVYYILTECLLHYQSSFTVITKAVWCKMLSTFPPEVFKLDKLLHYNGCGGMKVVSISAAMAPSTGQNCELHEGQ